MNYVLPEAVLASADISEITQLILRERESRDLAEWQTMRDCFHPDSIVRISWFHGSGPEFVDGSIDMARRGMLAKHRLAPVRVRLAGDRAVASLTAIIDIPRKIDGVDLILSAHGRFIYRAERRNEVWRIFSFECIYVRDELTPAIPGQTISIDPAEVAAFRPSYRNLAWCLMKTGYAVDQNLPGEDKPESVKSLLQEVQDWAGL
jgi:SnoaL-like domain